MGILVDGATNYTIVFVDDFFFFISFFDIKLKND